MDAGYRGPGHRARIRSGVDRSINVNYPLINASHSTLTIDAAQTMPLLKGLVMNPFLRRIFYGINFTPFIQEADRRATETGI